MSGMMDAAVTLYCRVEGRPEGWLRRVLRGVGLECADGAKAGRAGLEDTGGAVLYIPAGTEGYMDSLAWQATGDAGRTGRWTLQPRDVFVPGVVDDEVDKSPAELWARHSRVYTVQAVTDYTGDGPVAHWEVSGA